MNTKLSIFCSRVIEAGWLAAVVAVPLFFNIHTARTFEPDKLTLMRSLAALMVVAWIIKLLEEGRVTQSTQSFATRLKGWLKQPFVLPTVLLVIAYIISTIFALSPRVGLWGSYQRLQGTYTTLSYIIIFALMAVNITDRNQIDRFINTVIIASVPVSLYGIIQHNGLDPLPWAGDVTRRVASNMGNAIFVASYLIMIVPITISRLIKSMTAIVTEENASWGHTILSAVYIFILAIQILTILYSQSRGPQIGLLGAFAVMGLLILLIPRQMADNRSTLSLKEMGSGVILAGGAILGAALGGGIGYAGGLGINALLSAMGLAVENVTLLGAALGGLIGFAGVYTYMAASNRGWRWLWFSWPILAAGAIVFVLLLNVPDGPLQPVRSVPYLSRLGQLTDTNSGTGKVRVLIWEGALKLISPHDPIGIDDEYTDQFNVLRPLIGYGPESMFNAFAFSYPAELAHVEARGSSADRSHNETMDSLVITGVLGFAIFYFLMGTLFYYALSWLGLVPTKAASYRLIGLMVIGSIIGTLTPYFLQGNFNLSAVGLPFGLFGALFFYACLQGIMAQPALSENSIPSRALLIIGILGALVGHFLEVHFVFSIAATYTYFWAYLGILVAIHRLQPTTESATASIEAEAVEVEQPARSKRKQRRNRRTERRSGATTSSGGIIGGGWEAWIGSQGLVMAIVLIILTFDFVPITFDWSTGRYSLLWMGSITFLTGLAIATADTAIKRSMWRKPINWLWGILIYLITSLGYAAFYGVFHGIQRQSVTRLAVETNRQLQTISQMTDAAAQQQALVGAAQSAVNGAYAVFNLLVGFYVGLFILLLIMGFMLSQGKTRRIASWRASNWWLYPPLILAAVLLIWFKNINVVKADTFLKEGQKYRDAQLWDLGIAVHEEAVNADPDEDFYYLMLALNYQLKAQDNRLGPEARQIAWQRGEEIALEARNLNRFNPDNTGNMGRYYFTIAQIFDNSYFDKALSFFEKATELAPQNVDYYNLVGQAHYAQGDYESALTWYDRSIEIDDRYFPSWLFKGDTHVARQEIDEAINAHSRAIMIDAPRFVRENFDTRIQFYASANRIDDLISALETYLDENPLATRGTNTGRVLWGIGHIYMRTGDSIQASEFMEQAIQKGFENNQSFVELGNAYLAQEDLQRAEQAYQQALAQNPNQPQVYSSLGYIFARTGRLPQAIDANQKVLESIPNDYDSNKNLALLYRDTGELEQALTYARVALQSAPEANKSELEIFIAQVENQLQPSKTP